MGHFYLHNVHSVKRVITTSLKSPLANIRTITTQHKNNNNSTIKDKYNNTNNSHSQYQSVHSITLSSKVTF